ncbi:hypothetical protein HYH03_006895 [Edaphochlamys debaryana]|uniref:Uncharacterized protein n=1 Tax=Edaphochlamys debaryana TaxID=47281 RepID=A0A835Y9R0_9CHLO|nr:hypothetical protein HYH03_006895 [Edaphochlamys debaryana]|eukprot:KAG2494960.1 hypothetical protein HYH03_006895 [Edaphochlamys debaryana]
MWTRRGSWWPRALLVVTLGLLRAALASEDALPHVADCYRCFNCHVGKPPGRRLLEQRFQPSELPSATFSASTDSSDLATASAADGASGTTSGFLAADRRRQTLAAAKKGAGRKGVGKAKVAVPDNKAIEEPIYVPPGFKFQIAASREEIEAKARMPNCTECYGCDTQIKPLETVVEKNFGQNMRTEVGASPEWLFFSDLPDTPTTGKKAVIKVWCMPIDKVHGTFSWRCTDSFAGATNVQFLVAQQKVMEECGLLDVTIKVWPARVNAVVPKHGVHVWWDGLWMEKAEGISLNQLSYKRQHSFLTGALSTMFNENLNRTRVLRAAIYDLLTSQCDRHAQNVFMTETGKVTLIDNLQALRFDWQYCAMDSIFLPGTQKNMVVRWGGNIVGKLRNAKPRRSINPMTVLDYRCAPEVEAEGGRLGTNYDPQLKKCLTKLGGMTPDEIQKEYGFPYLRSAVALQSRAKAMITKGFEWALRYSLPRNVRPKIYRQQPPCCNFTMPAKAVIQCGHPWKDEIETPYGEPGNGGEWARPYPDPGSYEGGTYLDPPLEKD